MSIDATNRPGRLAAAPPAIAPEHARNGASSLSRPRVPAALAARRPPRRADRHTLLAGVASASALGVMVATSLLVVSLAAAHYVSRGFLVPAAEAGYFPSWLAGPAGVVTNWFTVRAHTARGRF